MKNLETLYKNERTFLKKSSTFNVATTLWNAYKICSVKPSCYLYENYFFFLKFISDLFFLLLFM